MARLRYFRSRGKLVAFVPHGLLVCLGLLAAWLTNFWVALSLVQTYRAQHNRATNPSPAAAARVSGPRGHRQVVEAPRRDVRPSLGTRTAPSVSSTTSTAQSMLLPELVLGGWESSMENCNMRLDAVLQVGSITLQQDQTGELSGPLLDRMASIAKRCSGGALVVEGDVHVGRVVSRALIKRSIPKERIITMQPRTPRSPPFPHLRVYIRPD